MTESKEPTHRILAIPTFGVECPIKEDVLEQHLATKLWCSLRPDSLVTLTKDLSPLQTAAVMRSILAMMVTLERVVCATLLVERKIPVEMKPEQLDELVALGQEDHYVSEALKLIKDSKHTFKEELLLDLWTDLHSIVDEERLDVWFDRQTALELATSDPDYKIDYARDGGLTHPFTELKSVPAIKKYITEAYRYGNSGSVALVVVDAKTYQYCGHIYANPSTTQSNVVEFIGIRSTLLNQATKLVPQMAHKLIQACCLWARHWKVPTVYITQPLPVMRKLLPGLRFDRVNNGSYTARVTRVLEKLQLSAPSMTHYDHELPISRMQALAASKEFADDLKTLKTYLLKDPELLASLGSEKIAEWMNKMHAYFVNLNTRVFVADPFAWLCGHQLEVIKSALLSMRPFL